MESNNQIKSAKAVDYKNIKKLTQRQTLARLRDAKQVGNYKMPSEPTSKGKGKGKSTKPDHRQWIPCPLLPGVPSIPPPKIPQPWEVLRSHETTAAAEDAELIIVKESPLEMTAILKEEKVHNNRVENSQRRDNDFEDIAHREFNKIPQIDEYVHREHLIMKSNNQIKSAKAVDYKNIKKLTQRQTLARLRDAKQVGNYKMPSVPTSKGKGKGKSTKPDHRQWSPCPLLPGVPSIPPPKIPQPWEVLRSHETTAAAEDAELIIVKESPLGLTKDRRTPQAKKRLIQLSPSTGVIQATELTSTPVWADIEFLNFTPSTITSRTEALGSGRSAISNMSLDIDVDIEHDLGSEVNSGSEMEEEEENPVNILLHPLLNPNNIVEGLDEPDRTEATKLMSLDADEDQAIRNMAAGEADVLYFDWSSDYKYFEGVREEFSGPSGPTFDHSGMSPLQVFQQIWDTNIIDHIVNETNKYARELQAKRKNKVMSRISRWKETTREEIWRFLSVLILQSLIINNVEREYWYPSNDYMRIGSFGKLMSYNRFLLIKRCLHFTDNSSLPEHPSKLHKIMPIIAHLNIKFGTLYLPEQNVAIDESLLLWKGRLSFSQKISTKRAREGIKSYEICESRTGYLWKMEVYTGKGHIHAPQEAGAVAVVGQDEDEPENATSKIVFNLMRPLFGKGHTLVMDNYYNSPLLSRILKLKHQTDTMGTLRLNREFVPEGLKVKSKKNMKPGEVCFSSTKDLCVVVYMDKNIVPMISTFHKPEVGGIVKYGYYKYRPKVILDYNLSMGGIDRKDQLLSSFPIERSRNLCWYKKLFRRLLNVSIHNASVIHDHGRTGSDKLGNRAFRLQLIKELLDTYCDTPQTPQSLPTLSEMHLPVKVKTQRCRLCYKNKVKRTTVWSCGTCRVNLCIMGCYTDYHKGLCE